MKLLFCIFYFIFQPIVLANTNLNDFEKDIKLGLNGVLAIKDNNLTKYNKIKSQTNIDVLKDAMAIVSLNYINYNNIDLKEIYYLLEKYPELKNIVYKFATPLLHKLAKCEKSDIAHELLNIYTQNKNLSLDQKIKLIDVVKNLRITQQQYTQIINDIWRETYFNNDKLWKEFLRKYNDILTSESHFYQAKILLLYKKYNLIDLIKTNIKNKNILAIIYAGEKIAKNHISDFSFLEHLNLTDDILVILLMNNLHDKSSAENYYKIAMKTSCNSGSLIKNALWKKYKYITYEVIKNASITEYEMAYNLLNKCQNFEQEAYIRQQFLLGWISLEFLHKSKNAILHFTKLIENAKDPISFTRGYYWLARTYASIDDSPKARYYFDLASLHPFYFYGQMAMYETEQDVEKTIVDNLKSLNTKAINSDDKTDNIVNLLTYIAKIFYQLGRHDIAKFYTKYMLELPQDYVLKAAGLYKITHKTEIDFAINMGRYGRLNGAPLIDISYPEHHNKLYPSIIKAVILKESMFDSTTLSTKNAKGLMQVRDEVFNTISLQTGVKKIKENKDNVWAGSYLLQKLLNRYNNNILALAAYNAGPTSVSRWIKNYGRPDESNHSSINWIESIPYPETFNYVTRVIELLIVYEAIKTFY